MNEKKAMIKKAPFFIFLSGIFICLPIFFISLKLASAPAFGQTAASSQNAEIKLLNDKIQQQKDHLKQLQDKQAQFAQVIEQKQSESATLNNQLAILDNQTAKLELDIESTQTEIDRINLEIKKTNTLIAEKQADIDREKTQVSAALRLLYKQDRTSTLEILLLNNSLSEFLDQAKYLEDVNKELSDSLDALKLYKGQLDEEMATLVQNNKDELAQKNTLEDQKQKLEVDKENKGYLLTATHDSERQYQKLLAQAKQEQLSAESDISAAEKAVREKMSKISAHKLEFNDNGFIWPVPKNTITAYFHDPDYPFRYVFEHPAIDIRAPQASPIKAAASGYVARAKDGGKGYSYIMLIHGDSLATVYGHVSKILVQEDEYVTQGQIIGLSGGLPGTPGAGPLTTGSHLHFEVRLNGIPVDPLNYLP